MPKVRTNLSIDEHILKIAEVLQDRLFYGSTTSLFEALVREKYEKEIGPVAQFSAPEKTPKDKGAHTKSVSSKHLHPLATAALSDSMGPKSKRPAETH